VRLPNDSRRAFRRRQTPKGDSPVTTRLRLALLSLALAGSLLAVPVQAFAARAKVALSARPLRESWFTTSSVFVHVRPHAKRAHVDRAKTLGVRAVSFARHLIGVPYSWGGTSPRTGFDCSGFVRFVYQHFGVRLPHSSYGDFALGRKVSRQGLRPGDLVFFDGLGHVGLYVGNGRFIHAPHSGTRVEIDSLTGWYAGRYDGARRLA
jgi:cell wall-associated NlpC family hydrolase